MTPEQYHRLVLRIARRIMEPLGVNVAAYRPDESVPYVYRFMYQPQDDYHAATSREKLYDVEGTWAASLFASAYQRGYLDRYADERRIEGHIDLPSGERATVTAEQAEEVE